MCSRTVSDTANRLLKRTDSEGSSSVAEKKSSAVPLFRSGHMLAICTGLSSKGKAGVQRGRETTGVPSFLPPRRAPRRSRRPQTANPPAEVQRKTPRPSGANPLAQFVYPAQPVLKRSRPSGANTLTQFVSPAQPVLKKLPPVRGEPACGSSCPPAGQCRKYIQKELLHPCSSSFVC